MLDALRWLITVELIGLAAFPLAFYLLPRLADRGFTLSKPLGILLVSYLFWLLGLAHIPTVQPIAIALVLLMAALSAYIAYRNFDDLRDFITREWRTIVIAEAIFLVFFIGWTLFRSYDPFINHTEQPMDLALLSASINSQVGHPEDPWLRGEPVSYYYFGYWMMGALSQISAIQSHISYNLAIALIPAMSAMGIFGIVFNMVRMDKARSGVAGTDSMSTVRASVSAALADSTHRKLAIIAGIAAALFLVIVSNLEGVLEFMRLNGMGSQGFYDWIRINDLPGPIDMPPQSWTPPDFWWWFHASRVINTFDGVHFIDNTIQEFPFFSFLLGDMHPHVMSIPFIALFVGIALNIYRLPSDFWRNYRSVYPYAIVLTAALVLGGLGFNNLWDMPTFAALLIGILALKGVPRRQRHSAVHRACVLPRRLGNSRTRRPDVLPLPAGHQRRRERHRSRHHAHPRHPHVHRLGTVLDGGNALPAGDILADHRPARLGGTDTHGRRARIRPVAAMDARLPAQRRQRRRGNRPLHRHPPPHRSGGNRRL